MNHQYEEEDGDGSSRHKDKQITFRISATTARIIVVVIVLGVLGYFLKGFFVVASVNGSFISRWAVIEELEKVSGKQALDSLIAKKLVFDDAWQKGITVSNDEINAEVTKAENQVKAQGETLDQVLSQQGIALDTFKKQLLIQKTLEKLVIEKVQVGNDEIAQFIKDNKVVVPAGQEDKYNGLVKDQLTQQKLTAAEKAYVSDLKSHATIHTFVRY